MTHLARHAVVSVDEYLAHEDGADCRHEYINGQVYAMTGASDRHCLITLNIAAYLRPSLRGTPCQLFVNDMKVRLRISEQDIFYYPDVLLSCDPNDRETYYRSAPCMVIEVLSESTARIDRREKLLSYRLIPSLQEYILIEQQQRRLEVYRRANDWQQEIIESGSLSLVCLNHLKIPLGSIYEDVF